MKKLTLYNGPNSPFGRKTKITAIIQEIKIEEKIIKVQEAVEPGTVAVIIE